MQNHRHFESAVITWHLFEWVVQMGKNRETCSDELERVYRDSAPSFNAVHFWAAEVKNGQTS